ncbi:MAG: nickel pincer cofactor biosynthesis protein LarB [Candidatus Saganbacteria bacterium]|nr:nickel pincer cofactor biosynthesis protein LarB [Candidatus Saganbacteria bacterium]
MSKKAYEDIGFAKIDHLRIKRKGFPEVIFCQGKTPAQIAQIAKRIAANKHDVLATRADRKDFQAIKKVIKKAKYHPEARIVTFKNTGYRLRTTGSVAIITAGTSDIPVAEEAAVTAEFLGLKVDRIFDVGVAGIHRLASNLERINKAKAVIVVAGMEGALPSVVGGLIEQPVIAVPTSVGYGANFKGLSALLTMMNSCAPGVAVVNIDNGFGAAVMAFSILKSAGASPSPRGRGGKRG